jgi:polyisoprenoid-binding protein YceI
MKKLTACLTAMLFASAIIAQTAWTIDKEHSSINFSVSHFLVSQTTGRFRDFDAKMISRTDDFAGATVTFMAKTASVCTDNEQRDHHLQSEDFLNSEKYPEIMFTGTLTKEADRYLLKGNLTIRGITRPVSFAATYVGRVKDSTFHADKVGFTVTGSLNRSAYGLKWNETFQGGGPIVGDQVTLNLNIEVNRQE